MQQPQEWFEMALAAEGAENRAKADARQRAEAKQRRGR